MNDMNQQAKAHAFIGFLESGHSGALEILEKKADMAEMFGPLALGAGLGGLHGATSKLDEGDTRLKSIARNVGIGSAGGAGVTIGSKLLKPFGNTPEQKRILQLVGALGGGFTGTQLATKYYDNIRKKREEEEELRQYRESLNKQASKATVLLKLLAEANPALLAPAGAGLGAISGAVLPEEGETRLEGAKRVAIKGGAIGLGLGAGASTGRTVGKLFKGRHAKDIGELIGMGTGLIGAEAIYDKYTDKEASLALSPAEKMSYLINRIAV